MPYADYLLTVKIDGVGFTNSYVVPLCVAESLAILIGQKIGTDSKQRLADLDFILAKIIYIKCENDKSLDFS